MMSKINLPGRRGVEKHREILESLVKRYKKEDEFIDYKDAAPQEDKTIPSEVLRFFYNLGLLKKESGTQKVRYEPIKPLLNCITKVGETKDRAREELIKKNEKRRCFL